MESTTLNLPSFPGACFEISLDLREAEGALDLYNTLTREYQKQDDELTPSPSLTSEYCKEAGGAWVATDAATDGKLSSSYRHYLNYGDYYERLDAQLNFIVSQD
ncbi:MAG: hypothetical protein AB8G23_02880 [Myxococcota bacterium]